LTNIGEVIVWSVAGADVLGLRFMHGTIWLGLFDKEQPQMPSSGADLIG
jgi:hypothetical protein